MKDKFNTHIDNIGQLIGKDKLRFDKESLEEYSSDESSDLSGDPQLIVFAEDSTDVSRTLKYCRDNEIIVIPRGTGTGVTGGATAINGGVVLSMERMNRIIEIDSANMVAVVEPGVITGNLQKAALEMGLMYPPDPASLETCSIGGNVTVSSGGPRAVKYGTTRDYVLGLEFVTTDGSIMQSGGKVVKNATGFNLTGLLVGSEGTLAVITKIFIKLIPAPMESLDLLIPFDSIDDAIDAVATIIMNRIIPSTIEFMESETIKIVSDYLGSDSLFPHAGAHLIVQLDGHTHEDIVKDSAELKKCLGENFDNAVVAKSDSDREKIWQLRRNIRKSIENRSPIFLAEDCAVPRANIPVFVKDIKGKLNEMNLFSLVFGHAGDGNVHLNILKGDMDIDRWHQTIPSIKKLVYTTAKNYGGVISGEHGIGYLKKNFIDIAFTKEEIELQKRIKAAFDPENILNPGKIFN